MSALMIELGETAETPRLSPSAARMNQLVQSYWIARAIHLAVRSGIPDALAAHSRNVKDLARECGLNEFRLARLMRALADAGVFQELRPGVYATTALARTLESKRESSLRDFILTSLGERQDEAWEEFERGLPQS